MYLPPSLDPLMSGKMPHHTSFRSTSAATRIMQKGVVYLLHIKKGLIFFANEHGRQYELVV